MKFKCFICDNVFLTLYSTHLCIHKFCKVCGRNYYEELIELGIFSCKCPKYSCDKYLDMRIIRSLISPSYYKKIKNKKNIFSQLKSSSEKKLNQINKIEDIYDKCLFNRNIFEFTEKPNDIIKGYLKLKSLVCTKCGKPSLFGRNSNLYVKCLNCSFQLCKYCFKEYNDEHLNQRSQSYCKIFFRNRFLIKGKKSEIFFHFICFFVGYLVFLTGMNKKICSFFISERKHPFIFSFVFILFYFFIIFFSFFIFPYYPLIIVMFG